MPGTSIAGNYFNVTVTALDANGNVATGFRGSVGGWTSSDPRARLPYTDTYAFTASDNGTHVFTNAIALYGAASTTSISAVFSAGCTGCAGGTTSTAVTPAAMDKFVVSGHSDGHTRTAGVPIAIRVTAKDAWGNTTPSYGGTVRFSSWTDSRFVPGPNYAFTAADAGSHLFQPGIIFNTPTYEHWLRVEDVNAPSLRDDELVYNVICPTNTKTCWNEACIPLGGCCSTESASVACNDQNACTYGDHCNGAGQCVGAAVTCNAAAGERCNGTSTCDFSCVGVYVVCRAPVGPCDKPESCNGVDAACPADDVLPAGSPCAEGTATMDPALCDGASKSCPAPCVSGSRRCPDGSCIPSSLCCADSHCPPPPSGQGMALCQRNSCTVACAAGLSNCNGDCIAGCCPFNEP